MGSGRGGRGGRGQDARLHWNTCWGHCPLPRASSPRLWQARPLLPQDVGTHCALDFFMAFFLYSDAPRASRHLSSGCCPVVSEIRPLCSCIHLLLWCHHKSASHDGLRAQWAPAIPASSAICPGAQQAFPLGCYNRVGIGLSLPARLNEGWAFGAGQGIAAEGDHSAPRGPSSVWKQRALSLYLMFTSLSSQRECTPMIHLKFRPPGSGKRKLPPENQRHLEGLISDLGDFHPRDLGTLACSPVNDHNT